MKFLLATLLILPPLVGTAAKQSPFPIPEPLVAEHRALHETLERAVHEPGPLGAAAKKVDDALRPHFQREEEIALPPLALLPKVARGEVSPDMADVLRMTDQLEVELPRMLEEHRQIARALEAFRKAAVAAKRKEYIEFADDLRQHAQTEEQVLYPAALLVGRYVKLALKH